MQDIGVVYRNFILFFLMSWINEEIVGNNKKTVLWDSFDFHLKEKETINLGRLHSNLIILKR